ncbi:hypothetical protein NL676_018057 [Syzygium grande]|nr:hypothetical protein NL676_018057 [Syzygium grande]
MKNLVAVLMNVGCHSLRLRMLVMRLGTLKNTAGQPDSWTAHWHGSRYLSPRKNWLGSRSSSDVPVIRWLRWL